CAGDRRLSDPRQGDPPGDDRLFRPGDATGVRGRGGRGWGRGV
ncbi:MAG: hypothetical protein AVDCRST_MAG73-660, partial [uncultured Thermomicrobiales bacterium]